jgi:hypothetical protein
LGKKDCDHVTQGGARGGSDTYDFVAEKRTQEALKAKCPSSYHYHNPSIHPPIDSSTIHFNH